MSNQNYKRNRSNKHPFSRKQFINITSASIGSLFLPATSLKLFPDLQNTSSFSSVNYNEKKISIIGQYGQWASSLIDNKLPVFSFRNKDWNNLETWKKASKKRLKERLGIPDIGGIPIVNVSKKYSYDGLQIEELNWQLPYGRPTEAILLKPLDAKGKLPGILAFHDHGANKYFGTRKITRTDGLQHPLMEVHQKTYYEKLA
jgi:hypothetical protein